MIDWGKLETAEQKADKQAQVAHEARKRDRAEAVGRIQVTTSTGKTFDGDETSQLRMFRAGSRLPDGQTIEWVLADNIVALVTREELLEAHDLAAAEQSALWTLPYEVSE